LLLRFPDPGFGVTMRQVRSIFLSDIHLGTKACQAHHLLDFLKAYSAEHVFLLGDIVDSLVHERGGIHWPPAQNTFVQKMLRRAPWRKVIFIPATMMKPSGEYIGSSFGNIRSRTTFTHGRRRAALPAAAR
jgi:UDP-2,3-diacylglucosamine pyrophosphatase LpxH